LAAILLPILASAKAKAMSTQCRNNQKQMGIAMRMYADDHEDWMAPPGWDNGSGYNGNGRIFPGWLYTVTKGAIPDPGPGGTYENNKNAAYQTGLWFQYISNPSVYLCPVDIKSRTYVTKGLRHNRMSSYVMNGAVCGYGDPDHFTCKVVNVWSPMCWLQWEPDENAFGFENPGEYEFNDSANSPTAGSTDRGEDIGRLHSKKGGFAVAIDGHVALITKREWAQDVSTQPGHGPGPGGRTYLWWNPFSDGSDDGH
jgi:hypothetical protein